MTDNEITKDRGDAPASPVEPMVPAEAPAPAVPGDDIQPDDEVSRGNVAGGPLQDGADIAAAPAGDPLPAGPLHLEAVVAVVRADGVAVAQGRIVSTLLQLPGGDLESSFRYLTGKSILDAAISPELLPAPAVLADPLPVASAPQEPAGLAAGEVVRVNVPGSLLDGCAVRVRGLLDVADGAGGWRPVPGLYSCDILEGDDAGGTTTVTLAQVRK